MPYTPVLRCRNMQDPDLDQAVGGGRWAVEEVFYFLIGCKPTMDPSAALALGMYAFCPWNSPRMRAAPLVLCDMGILLPLFRNVPSLPEPTMARTPLPALYISFSLSSFSRGASPILRRSSGGSALLGIFGRAIFSSI
eukprot:CAMPEP_0173351980 /NCGR_PEP_ID=MMETSP1144-20121109/15761_1 /TAXON_ID=483371 /ORGANISM="non described non described, Strain CCMP2298" /LENGTH=137 /DNA_ID=CAMNT_0014300139 /DNA_START=68 /DNA_END=481 /DNA_ORIENTATION=+